MKRILLTIFCSLCALNTFSQISNALTGTNELIREKKYEEIEGTPYLFDDWIVGTITDNSGKTYTDVLLKYDIYKERVEYSDQGKIYEVSNSMYKKFTLNIISQEINGIKKLSFTNEDVIPGFPKNSYVQVLLEGQTILYKKHKTFFLQENVTSYGSTMVKKQFQPKVFYFIKTGDKLIEVKISRSALLEIFPEHSGYIKANKFKKEEDLVRLIENINTQQK